MEKVAALIGIAAGGFYIYNELEKQKNDKKTSDDDDDHESIPDATTDSSGQTNITQQGTDVFQQIDRTFAYTLLLKAHSDVTDFDSLTDSDLEQLLRAINIDPAVLRTHMTQEQADFLIHSAEQAAHLRVEITIDQATKNQWNTMIRASKKRENEDWALQRRGEIDVQFATDPYTNFYNINFAEFLLHHGGMMGMNPVDLNAFYSYIGNFASDNHIRTWAIETAQENDMTITFIGHIDELTNQLKALKNDRKQDALDLLAVNLASKNSIVDSTDYVALSWRVDDDGNIIAPS